MMIQFLTFFILILACYVNTNQQLLQIGEQRTVALLQGNGFSYTFLAQTIDLTMNSHLAIQMQPVKSDTYNEILISVFTHRSQPITKCSSVKSIGCLVPFVSLSSYKQIRIQITSNSENKYRFSTRWTNFTLVDKQVTTVELNKNIAQYYQISLSNGLYQSLRLILTPNNNSQLYGKLAVKTQLSYPKEYETIDLWNGAQGIFFSKLQLSGHKYLYVTVIGQRYATYNLSYQVLLKDHHDLEIPEEVYQFIAPYQRKQYHIKCEHLNENQQLVVQFQIYSGNLQAMFYLDSQMKNPFKTKYFHFMADSKFSFTKAELKGVNDVYFKILSTQRKLTFKLMISIALQEKAELLSQNSYNFQSVMNKKYLFFYLKPQMHQDSHTINVSISFMNLLGSTKLKMFTGQSPSLNCLPECQVSKFTQIKNIRPNMLGLKNQYKLVIPNKNLNMSSIVLLKLERSNQKKMIQQVTIQYQFENSLIQLRENYPLTQVVDMGQTKYYKYKQRDKKQVIRICTALVSGNIGVLGSYTNPLVKGHSAMTAYKDCVVFSPLKIYKQVYISVYGVYKSKYAISLQIGHQKQIAESPTLQTNQDIDYEVTIAPQGSYIFTLHPIYPHMRVVYNSSRPMTICFIKTNESQSGCLPQLHRQFEVAGQFYLKQGQNDKEKSRKLKVTNPSPSDNIVFKLKYHSGDYDHCELKLMNKIYEQDILTNVCYQFQLPSSIQAKSGNQVNGIYKIMLKYLQLIDLSITVGICGKNQLKFKNTRIIQIKSSQVLKYCEGQQNKVQLIVQVPANLQKSLKIQYILQSIQQVLRLATNIKFNDRAIISENDPLRQYIVNKNGNNNMILFFKQYTPIIYSKISVYVGNQLSYSSKTFHQLKSMINYTLKSDLQVSFAILAVQVDKQCRPLSSHSSTVPSECDILIVIQPRQRTHIGQQLQYSIQVKQTNRELKQYQPQTSLLALVGQSDVYNYYPTLEQPTQSKYSALLQISTHNEQCLYIYVNRYENLNKNKSLIDKLSYTNIFPIDANAYVIEVEAYIPNCRYSIQVHTIINNKNNKDVQILHPQIHYDINMSENQVIHYIADLQSKTNKRILYVRKLGDIRMYATPYTKQTYDRILVNQSYTFIQTDYKISEQFPNILNLPISQNNLYIVAVQAQSNSQGTLILHNKDIPIVIPHSKKIVDNINSGQKSTLKFYTPNTKLKSGYLKVDLIYGRVNIQASFIVDSNQRIIEVIPTQKQKYIEAGQTEQIKFQFNGLKNPQYLEIVIKNEESSKDIAIFQVSIELEQKQQQAYDIDKDSLTTLQLFKQEKTLIKTKLIAKQHKIIVSALSQNHLQIQQQQQQQPNYVINKTLSTQDYSGNAPANLNEDKSNAKAKPNTILDCIQVTVPFKYKQMIQTPSLFSILDSVLVINIEWTKFIYKYNYDILLELTLSDLCPVDNFTINISPSLRDKMSILSPFKWAYLKNQRNFAVASKSQFLIDIVSCSGPVQMDLAKSFSQLYSSKQLQQVTSVIKNQPHIFRIRPTQSITYFKLTSHQATIRYISPNFEKEEGVGYLKYEWGYFLYQTDFQKLSLYLNPIKNISQTKTQLLDAQYLIRVIGGIDPIRTNAQCIQIGQKTVYWRMLKGNNRNEQTILYISKQQLLNELKGNPEQLYISIDLVITLQTPSGKRQTYKFLAPVQQIPIDIFNITRLNAKIIGIGIVIIVAVIFGCIFLAQIFIKYVVPFLGRIRRNNQLVEEDAPTHSEKQHQTIPASSDRNQRPPTQIQPEIVLTQEKMQS